MTDMPEESDMEILVSTTRTMRVELDEDQLVQLIKDWAKSRGFSHRAEVEIETRYGNIEATVIETQVTSTQE